MKKIVELVKELKKTNRGKAILFFSGYLIFFIFVFLILMFGEKSTTSPSDYEKGKSSSVSMSNILSDNYLFTYKINLDGNEYIFSGKRNKGIELFQANNKEYYRNGDSFFVKNGDLWIKSDNPYAFNNFIDSSKISSILELSSVESTTSYEDGRYAVNLLISTNTLNQKFNNLDSDFLEEPNKIVVSTNTSHEVNEIVYDLDSYCKLNNQCTQSLKITLSYDMFGEIKDIENPVV